MKAFVLVMSVLTLGGCASITGGADGTGPSKLPDDAITAMWSMKPVAEVQACLTGAGAPASYQVRDISSEKGTYPTLVAVTARVALSDEQNARFIGCL